MKTTPEIVDKPPPVRQVRGASLYFISQAGELFSFYRNTYRKLHPGSGKAKYLSSILRHDDGIQRTKYIHHMVAHAWLGDPPPGTQCIRHMDGNRQNNHSSNLRYGTSQENSLDMWRHNTMPCGEKNPMAKLTQVQVVKIRKMLCDSVPRRVIMKRFHVSPMTISRIARNTAWRNP